jgi:acyl-coenzyme A thioesterase PaaI-like protein
MALADVAMYAALLGEIGLVPLAVTTNLNINFLRKPAQKDVYADARLLKVGKRLAVGEITLYSDGDPEPVAHVTCTYSIPPRSSRQGR